MKEWNIDKLKEMSKQGSEYSKHELDYVFIAENFEEIVVALYENGDVVPLQFLDVNVAYPTEVLDDVVLPEISEDLLLKYDENKSKQKIINIKHFSRDITHEDWLNFINQEIDEFIDNYPQFKEVLK